MGASVGADGAVGLLGRAQWSSHSECSPGIKQGIKGKLRGYMPQDRSTNQSKFKNAFLLSFFVPLSTATSGKQSNNTIFV